MRSLVKSEAFWTMVIAVVVPFGWLAYFFAAANSLICTRPTSAYLPLPSGLKIVLQRLRLSGLS